MEPRLASFGEPEFRDSAKVLRDLLLHLNGEEASRILLSAAGTGSSESGKIAIGILKHMQEVIDNAPTQTRVPNRSTRQA